MVWPLFTYSLSLFAFFLSLALCIFFFFFFYVISIASSRLSFLLQVEASSPVTGGVLVKEVVAAQPPYYLRRGE